MISWKSLFVYGKKVTARSDIFKFKFSFFCLLQFQLYKSNNCIIYNSHKLGLNAFFNFLNTFFLNGSYSLGLNKNLVSD